MLEDHPEPGIDPGPLKPEKAAFPSWFWFTSAFAAAIFLGFGLLFLVRPMLRPLALFMIGITISSALAPAINRLERRMHRGLAIAIVYIVLLLLVVGIFSSVIPLLVAQARDFGTRVPNLFLQLQSWLGDFLPLNLSTITSSIGALGYAIMSLPIAIVNSLVDLLLIFFISLYWLILSPSLKENILSLFPAQHHPRVLFVLQQMGRGMGGYLRASAINGVIIGVLTYIGLVIIGVNYPAVLSLVMGLLEIIPALGPVMGGAFIVLVAFLQAPHLAIISLIFVIVLQQTEGHILVPNVMKTQTEISPLLVIFALVTGAAIGSLLGALVAIPVMAALRVLVHEFAVPAIRRRTGASVD